MTTTLLPLPIGATYVVLHDSYLQWNGARADAPFHMLAVPRNAPCPCGSGRKYKKCCMKEIRP